MIKGAIFDMDGTVADSENLVYQAYSELMKEYGITITSEEYGSFVGGTNSVAEYLHEKHDLPLTLQELVDKKKARVDELLMSVKPMPYALEAIDFFASRNFLMALATSTNKDQTMMKLKALNIMDKFLAVHAFEDIENHKPHPEIYLKSARAIGLNPEECLAFEDTVRGVKAAKAAGCFTIAIPNNFTTHLDFSEADQVFGDFSEALEFIKSNLLD